MSLLNFNHVYLLAFSASFITTFLIIPWLIPKIKARGIVGVDMNKPDKPAIPEMGGIAVVLGFFIGVYLQIVMHDLFSIGQKTTEILIVSVIAVIGIAFVGILDDLLGMRQRTKAILPMLFTLPLGVFVSKSMFIPFLGEVDFSYTMLILVPFGVTCAANSMNMLEGFNGLSTGLGVIITIALIILAVNNGTEEGLYLLVPLLGALVAFFCYNKYPAKIFPGDTLTLFTGGIIGCAAVVSNLKLEGVIMMTPMIVEFFLKFRGGFKAECFATSIHEDILRYKGPIESLTHLIMVKFTVTEKKVLMIFFTTEILLAVMVIFLSAVKII